MELAATAPAPQQAGQQPLARAHGPPRLVAVAFHVIASQELAVLLEPLPRNIPRVGGVAQQVLEERVRR